MGDRPAAAAAPACATALDGQAAAQVSGPGRAAEVARGLKAVADPARLQIIALLRASADGELCACDFPAALGLSQPTVSHHLKVLVAAGVLARRQDGVWAHFRLEEGRLAALADELRGTPAPG